MTFCEYLKVERVILSRARCSVCLWRPGSYFKELYRDGNTGEGCLWLSNYRANAVNDLFAVVVAVVY